MFSLQEWKGHKVGDLVLGYDSPGTITAIKNHKLEGLNNDSIWFTIAWHDGSIGEHDLYDIEDIIYFKEALK